MILTWKNMNRMDRQEIAEHYEELDKIKKNAPRIVPYTDAFGQKQYRIESPVRKEK